MSGHTVTQPAQPTCAPSRAARELGLKRGEFDLAVHLGRVRTVPDDTGAGKRVTQAELDRLRGEKGFPASLRESVQVVGTTAGAALMEISSARFTRLARLGLLIPVKFYLNRYRAVVWLYLADDLRQFAAGTENSAILRQRMPERLRNDLGMGLDRRPRNWRQRHLGFLLRQATDPWQRAGALAAFLGPVQIAEIVKDPYERAHVHRFRPPPPSHGAPGSPGAQLAERLMTADGPDEIAWLRSDLTQTLREARAHRAAPRPVPREAPEIPAPTVPATAAATTTATKTPAQPEGHAHEEPLREEPDRPRGLLSRLLRRGPRPS
ncbi:DUF6397 family protein [Streptomyces sp. NPDC006997]|uniref:DUF6397 family protein n=1 Tax=Streptomyces sp. NPDC006997 TaxID=3155356 RepID=UPI0033C4FD6C